jgi:hypothetical protein
MFVIVCCEFFTPLVLYVTLTLSSCSSKLANLSDVTCFLLLHVFCYCISKTKNEFEQIPEENMDRARSIYCYMDWLANKDK